MVEPCRRLMGIKETYGGTTMFVCRGCRHAAPTQEKLREGPCRRSVDGGGE